MLIIGLDVGSVRRKGKFSWSTSDELLHGSDEPGELAQLMTTALNDGQAVALAVECPLAVPVPTEASGGSPRLGKARQGEGNRSWSAGAGTAALATGIVQLAWICSSVAVHASSPVAATTQMEKFKAGQARLLIAEAMVTADGKPEPVGGLQDHADAVAAARRLTEILEEGPSTSEVTCEPHSALNLAAVACMHAGLVIDPAELRSDIVVAKVRPLILSV